MYFTCTTIGSNTNNRIQLHENQCSGRGRAANAIIIDITANEIGEIVILSQLSLIVSTQYPVVSVSCGNNGHGMRESNSIIFNIAGTIKYYMTLFRGVLEHPLSLRDTRSYSDI